MAKIVALALLVSSVLVLSSCVRATSMSKRGGVRLCGGRLVEALTMVCGGDIYSPDLETRDLGDDGSGDSYPLWFMGLLQPKTSRPEGFPRLSKRQLMGVVDECCRKACSFSVLASYCSK